MKVCRETSTTKGQTTYSLEEGGQTTAHEFKTNFRTSLHLPMIPFGSLGTLPLLSLYVGALLSLDASPTCTHPPCRDSLVAAPIPPGTGVGVGTRACEGQTGTAACKMGVSLSAVSDVSRRVEHRPDFPQAQPKVSDLKLSGRSGAVLLTMGFVFF